jgi:sugar transferase (PEP-CTERM system associated)
VLNAEETSIADIALEKNAEEIVIAMDEKRGNLPVRQLLDARLQGIDVIELMEFFERETGKIRVDLVNPGWLIFSPGFRISRLRAFSSRTVDLLTSAGLFLVSWPIMLLVALAIKLEDGVSAPVLYRQCRVGKGGVPFQVLKFRSMSVDAEADGQAKWAEANDSRITRVGNVLRNVRLDELPQVFNVLRGQMSLVGPRPERPEFVQELKKSIPYYDERHAVKPGVTGWAQLKYSYGASEEDAIEKLQYDLYYIKNQSLMLDIMIILQTVEVVLWGKGAR